MLLTAAFGNEPPGSQRQLSLLAAIGALSPDDISGPLLPMCGHSEHALVVCPETVQDYAQGMNTYVPENLFSDLPFAYLTLLRFLANDLVAPYWHDARERSVQGRKMVVTNLRTGRLELASVYGGLGVQGSVSKELSRALHWPWDRAKLWTGQCVTTVAKGQIPPKDPGDLARDVLRLGRVTSGDGAPFDYGYFQGLPAHLSAVFKAADGLALHRAFIADARNDQNLLLSQFHLAVTRLHNRMVDRVDSETSAKQTRRDVFAEARRRVEGRFRRVVCDALTCICHPDILERLSSRSFGAGFFGWGTWLSAVQSVLALFRPNRLRINGLSIPEVPFHHLQQTKGQDGLPDALFGGGLIPARLVDVYQVDWRYLSDGSVPECQTPKSLDLNGTHAAWAADQMRNALMIAQSVGAPSGQTAACRMNADLGCDAPVLSHDTCVAALDLERRTADTQTPLPIYIVAEAEILGTGGRLGPLGSFVLAEPLLRALAQAKHRGRSLKPGEDGGLAGLLSAATWP